MKRKLLGVIVLVGAAVPVYAVAVPGWSDCRGASIQKAYSDGDWRLAIRCEQQAGDPFTVGQKLEFAALVPPPPPPPPPPPTHDEPKLILLTQSALHDTNGSEIRAWPSYIATKVAHIETLPFDGIAIHNAIGTELMNGSLHSAASIAAEWAPLRGVTWTRMQHNFAVVHVKRPNDFFDDWTNTIQSFQNLAIVLRDIGIQGILFDNEEYSQPYLWHYPANMKYASSTSLADYYAQARLRGGQIITAVQAVYPDIQFMVLLSPSENCPSTPSRVRAWTADPSNLAGAFTVGLMEQSNKPIVDGNEVSYAYRSQAEFDAAYQWRKTGMVAGTPCPFIAPSLYSTWSDRISISEAVYNQGILYANGDFRSMNPQIMNQVLGMALRGVDDYAWLYWEGANWFNPIGSTYGVPSEWHSTIQQAWLATRQLEPPPPTELTLTVSPAAVPTGGSSTTILVEWSGIPNPTPGDWLGIYPAGVAPHAFAVGNPRWKYVDCQQHVGAGVQPVPAGVCAFNVSGLAPGHYQTSLLANEGMTELARAEFTVVAAPPPLTLTVSPATVSAGGSSTTILVRWSGIPNPTPGDWLGIYPAGVAPHGFAVGNPRWKYVDCQQHVGAGVQPVPAGVCTFDVSGLAPGHYQTSLLANEGMTELARAEFTVVAGPPPLTLTVSPATVPTGGSSTTILVEWSGIPNPTPGDWLGIYPAGVAPHGFAVGNPRWKYVDCQQHVGAGVQPVPAGVCTFDVSGLAPGHYRTSLLANEGMTELARAEFTVEAGAPPPLSPPLPPPPPPPSGSTSVLTPGDFTYLGGVRAPGNVIGAGALAGKNENGQITLYMLSRVNGGELYSMRYNGNASIANPPTLQALFEGWPTWNNNTRLDTSWDYSTGAERRPNGNPWPVLGMAYDQARGQMYFSYLDYYNSAFGGTDHCLVVADMSKPEPSRSSGPYRVANTSAKRICGGLTITPEGLGMGGSMMALSRNTDNSWGPSLSILPFDAIGANPGGFNSPQLSVSEWLMHTIDERASRASDYKPNLADPHNPDGPMPPPGFWTQRDRMNAIAWIETASGKRGFLTMGGMATGQVWYGSWDAGPNGEVNRCQSADRGENAEGFRPEWRIYDPVKLTGGVVQPDRVFSPWDLSPEPRFGACELYYTGAYFDWATGLLFAATMGEIQVWHVR